MRIQSSRLLVAALSLAGTPVAGLAVLALPATPAAAANMCVNGYVWRDAADGDAVCVTPQERSDAKSQNANGRNNRAAGGGAYGPNTCRQGYVWREAFGGDVVCVTPYERSEAARQNAESAGHEVR